MNFHLAHTSTAGVDKRDQHNRKQVLAAGLGALLIAGTIAGSAVWKAGERVRSIPQTVAAVQTVGSAGNASVQPAGTAIVQPGTITMFYLVGSQDQAIQVQAGFDDVAPYWAAVGLQAPPPAIVVISAPDEESAVSRAIAETPNAGIMDLRAPAGAAGAAVDPLASVSAEPGQFTMFYLVGSQDQANAVQAGFNDEVRYWAAAGLPAPEPVIGVITTPDEESAFYTAASQNTYAEILDLRAR